MWRELLCDSVRCNNGNCVEIDCIYSTCLFHCGNLSSNQHLNSFSWDRIPSVCLHSSLETGRDGLRHVLSPRVFMFKLFNFVCIPLDGLVRESFRASRYPCTSGIWWKDENMNNINLIIKRKYLFLSTCNSTSIYLTITKKHSKSSWINQHLGGFITMIV